MNENPDTTGDCIDSIRAAARLKEHKENLARFPQREGDLVAGALRAIIEADFKKTERGNESSSPLPNGDYF